MRPGANGPFDMSSSTPGSATARRSSAPSAKPGTGSSPPTSPPLFDGAQLALPDLLDGDDKRLVIVASVAGLKGAPYAAPYAASKHGAVGLTRSLALEFVKTGLTVNAVCPGFVDTPMVDDSRRPRLALTGRSEDEARGALAAMNANGRLVTADEVGDHRSCTLCLPQSRSINGACVTIDGGTTA